MTARKRPSTDVVASPRTAAPATSFRGRRVSFGDARGAVMVEFLIAFLPVFTLFLCLLQLGLLFAVRLVVEHAATNAARAAAVIVGDDPKNYNNEAQNKLTPGSGQHYTQIRNAALLTLAPYILDGTIHSVKLEFPPPDRPEGQASSGTVTYAPMNMTTVSKVRVRLQVEANCKIGLGAPIACGFLDPFFKRPVGPLNRAKALEKGGHLTKNMVAEAMYPYQGASYAYP